MVECFWKSNPLLSVIPPGVSSPGCKARCNRRALPLAETCPPAELPRTREGNPRCSGEGLPTVGRGLLIYGTSRCDSRTDQARLRDPRVATCLGHTARGFRRRVAGDTARTSWLYTQEVGGSGARWPEVPRRMSYRRSILSDGMARTGLQDPDPRRRACD